MSTFKLLKKKLRFDGVLQEIKVTFIIKFCCWHVLLS